MSTPSPSPRADVVSIVPVMVPELTTLPEPSRPTPDPFLPVMVALASLVTLTVVFVPPAMPCRAPLIAPPPKLWTVPVWLSWKSMPSALGWLDGVAAAPEVI